MNLSDFLYTLFGAFENQNIQYAVIRNYAELPFHNSSKDIDVLVDKKTLPQIYNILFAIKEISIVQITKRTYVHNVYIYNIKDRSLNSLQLDLILEFEWKGVRYLDPQLVLKNAVKYNNINVISEYDEMLVLFFGKYILHGILKNEYTLLIKKVANENLQNISKALSFIVNEKITEEKFKLFLETNILSFDRNTLKKKLFFHFFSKNPVKTICRYFKHISTEFLIRVSHSTKYILLIDKSFTLSEIKPEIEHTTKIFVVFNPSEKFKLFLYYVFFPVKNHTTFIIQSKSKFPFIKNQFYLDKKEYLDKYIQKRSSKIRDI
ncbi:MAG: hypothetical protein GYA62_09645 [Bacteroidales bacterium]|nr:hypothetical protein [Bacteroidales bacterium]